MTDKFADMYDVLQHQSKKMSKMGRGCEVVTDCQPTQILNVKFITVNRIIHNKKYKK